MTWYTHILGHLLGNARHVPDNDRYMNTVFADQPMAGGPFTLQERREARKSLRMGKSVGQKNTNLSTIHMRDLDDRILDMCKLVHEKGETTKQWDDPAPSNSILMCNQNRLWLKRRAVEQVLALRTIIEDDIEGVKSNKLSAIVTFIDLKNVSKCLDRHHPPSSGK